ncbi:MAG: DMT family transporter [Pseudomonadota bacterium]
MSKITGESFKVITIILIGWSAFAFADVTSKILSEGYHPAFILIINGLLALILLIGTILFQKGLKGFLSPNWKWLIVRGACIAVTATGVVNALALIPIADLYGITFSAPFIAVVLSVIFLRESVGLHRWVSIIIGFTGVLILLGPQFNTMNTGILFAIAATISIAVGTIIIRKIGKYEYLPLFVLYPYIGILAVNIPLGIPEIKPIAAENLHLFIMNAILVLVGQLGVTWGTANAKATASVAPFVYIQVVWGIALGFLFFGDIPSITTSIGLFLVMTAGLYMIYRENKLNRKT